MQQKTIARTNMRSRIGECNEKLVDIAMILKSVAYKDLRKRLIAATLWLIRISTKSKSVNIIPTDFKNVQFKQINLNEIMKIMYSKIL